MMPRLLPLPCPSSPLIALFAILTSAALAAPAPPPSRPANYPRSYDDTIRAALGEGVAVVYGNINAEQAAPVLAGFRHRYPGVGVRYVDLSANELYRRFTGEIAARRPSADLVVSSAMDLQIKLINDGYAQSYASPEKPALPPLAVWKNQGWGVSAEPIAILYNRRLVPDATAPRTHAAFQALLEREPARFRGRVTTFDPARSGVGYLYLSQDLAITRDTWGLLGAIARVRPVLTTHTEEMNEGVASGRYALAYNAVGSYALDRAAHDPRLGVVLPRDYTLTMSRIALIPTGANHPAAARLFLDFLLSRPGQALLARRGLSPVRADVATATARPRPANAAPIRVGPQLLANLDRIKRQRFLRRWAALQPVRG
jgi:iron(III) transport system substrate-binding protein